MNKTYKVQEFLLLSFQFELFLPANTLEFCIRLFIVTSGCVSPPLLFLFNPLDFSLESWHFPHTVKEHHG